MTESSETSIWLAWWQRLRDDRPGRAELRRCGTCAEAVFAAPYHVLRRMKGNPSEPWKLERFALVAAVLAHVDEDTVGAPSIAALMASADGGEKAVVSDSRFRQILRTEASSADELLRELVRAIRQLGGRAPVHRLAEDLFWWNDRTRRQWALDYYDRAPRQAG